MKTHAACCIALALLLGCAVTARATQTQGQPPEEEASSPELRFGTGGPSARVEGREPPLRFGDPVELAYDADFFPGATYQAGVSSPDALLGQKHGTRLTHHSELLACFETWARESPRMTLHEMGVTHEGRRLVYAVITSEANQERIGEIQAGLAELANPDGLSDARAKELLADTPPVAWMAYSIHGDELSGSDAAIALAYHLVAGTNDEVTRMLDEVVTVIDPCENPDGRQRIISMVEQMASYTPNTDYAGMHRGRWPYGRGNHYLFDMNRDWMSGTQPETRARWKAVQAWHPQVFVDAHEMGGDDTYLFYPQADPFNPHLPADIDETQHLLGDGIAKAFDEYGWGYYTREWADAWGPFYSDAWGSLNNAIGMLYEQARTAGTPLKRPSGQVLTFRESVHHQIVASWATMETLRENRAAILESYLAGRRRNLAADTPGNDRMLVIRQAGRDLRSRRLVQLLMEQGVEVHLSSAGGTVANAVSATGESADSLEVPASSWVIPARQANGALVKAFCEFDIRMDMEYLQKEREQLERKGYSKVYDVTSWSLPHAMALDAWWCDAGGLELREYRYEPLEVEDIVRDADRTDPPYAWIVSGRDDSAVVFASAAMELGLQVYYADEEVIGEKKFPRGSLLIRRDENDGSAEELEARIAEACARSEATAWCLYTGRSAEDGPDLGGRHFKLLARPKVALLSNSPISTTSYGHVWHHLDRELGVPFTIFDAQRIGGIDLRRYNVLILPPGAGESLLEPVKRRLESWVSSGGTLIAMSSSAAALTKGRLGLSSVVLRRNALEDLELYGLAADRELEAYEVEIDEGLLWDGVSSEPEEDAEGDAEGDGKADADEQEPEEVAGDDEDTPETPKQKDAWLRRFSPSGASLLARCNPDAWLTAGCDEHMPVHYSGSSVFLSRPPVQTAVRLADRDRIRLGGLLWPEARERIVRSAWLTREGRGHGQIILFAVDPTYRGDHLGTARLFSNAVVLGPGLGANQPRER